MKRALLMIAVILGFSIAGKSQNKNYGQATQSSRDSVIRFMTQRRVAGAAVTVLVNGRIAWSEGFGFADLEQKVSVDPAKTKFRIGSISKSITATGLAILYERGEIQLDSSVYFYLPSFPKKKYRPTLRQLAGHTAGIRYYRNDEFLISKRYSSITEGLHIFQDDSLLFKPRTKYLYSSYDFNLLSAVLEKVSHKDFISFIRERVLTPLALTNTVPDFSDSLISNRSRFYEVHNNRWLNSPFVDNSYKWASGGFLSTSEDIAKLAHSYLQPGFLKKETIELFTTSQKLVNGKETGYGLGWATGKDKKGRTWFGHGGGSVGGTSNLIIYPREKVVVVVLTNITAAGLGNLPGSLAELFMK